MKRRKKLLAFLLASFAVISSVGCQATGASTTRKVETQKVETQEIETQKVETESKVLEHAELYVFIAASLKNTMETVKKEYESEHPEVTVIYNADSSGTLKTQIEEGARCDIFFSAATKQMDELEKDGFVKEGSVQNLLMNQMVLIKLKGKETAVTGFDTITAASSLALAGEDVPVGQYARKLFEKMGILDKVMSMEINQGPNVTAVLTAVAEGSNEVGIVYATDAASMPDQVEVIAKVDKDMLDPALYPVGLIDNKEASEVEKSAAADFMKYLTGSEEVKKQFLDAGFELYKK
ncbi:molybdate ABC transporter substrate-binding protein [Lacrimispora algidixylanolytica]|uniref:Molybdate-binding protein ModA n=1 Tax=Lacrimispora algidixylanolytica TaxID=94868 RepID=A0A419T2N9_9FIRM|nr:molybdate ABC transporter substrate-binding protein [Lacrimispora algidixylanolytica]RKD31699.1 molybdate ABC transporter substrate-binding protein [Lacrimispora algidixylanolytica]